MPLIKSPSKKAFESNLKAEMKAGKPKDQSLAISYSVQRKNKRKKMAEGGNVSVSAADEKRPMPDNVYGDSNDVKENSGKKPPKNDQWTDREPEKAASEGISVSLSSPPDKYAYSKEDKKYESDLMDNASPDGYGKQPMSRYDEEGADRQGPPVSDNERQHSDGKAAYADGGEINFHDEHRVDVDSITPEEMSMIKEYRMMARGGQIMPERRLPDEGYDHEEADGEPQSVADAIMRKRAKLKMAEGGEVNGRDSIYSDDSDMSDLSRNSDEDANMEDQSSFDALRKENYSESEGLNAIDHASKMDSGQHGDDRERSEEDSHDHIDEMRKKIKAKRGF